MQHRLRFLTNVDTEKINSVRAALERTCVKRECCSRQIYQKALKALDGDETAAQGIMDALIADKFVDDGRYAVAFAREKSALSGWGKIKIAYALRAKGISQKSIDQAWENVDCNTAQNRLEKLLHSKWEVLKDDPYGKFKLIKYALTRGYEYDEINSLVETIINRR